MALKSMPQIDVDIFWDMGTCPAPAVSSGYTIASNIRSLGLRFGTVKSFRAYLSVAEHIAGSSNGRALALRSELQSSGVSLIDTPGGKAVSATMLIVDMLAHAFELPRSSTTNLIMLISGDPNLAYALSVLRMRNHRMVVVCPSPEDAMVAVTSQAVACFDWDAEVMKGVPPGKVPWQSNGSSSSSNASGISPPPPPMAAGESALQLPTEALESAVDRTGHLVIDEVHQLVDDITTPSNGAYPPTYTSQLNAATTPPRSQHLEVCPTPLHGSSLGFKLDSPPTDLSEFRRSDEDEIVTPPRAVQTPTVPIQRSVPVASTSTSWAQVASLDKEPSSVYWNEAPKGNTSTTDDWQVPGSKKKKYSSIPSEFKPLVRVLKEQRAAGVYKPLWGIVAFELKKADPNIYENAEVSKFIQYATLAVEKRIAQIGGESGSQWIRLHPSLKV